MSCPVGIYYAFLANSDDVDFLDCLRRSKAAGLEILEASAPKLRALPADKRAEIAALASELDMNITFATALPPDCDTGSADAEIRKRGAAYLIEDLKLAKSMGVKAIGGILSAPGKYFPPNVENERYAMMDRAGETLREVGRIAEDMGIRLACEAVNRFESPVVNIAADALRVVEVADSPNVGILLDTFHMNMEEASLGDAIRLAGKHLFHVHSCENNRALPGQAHVNWDEVFSALKEIHYQGALVMESLPGPYGSVSGRLNIWRRYSENVDEELKQAVIFLHQKEEQYGL